jgi:hypothetical protein
MATTPMPVSSGNASAQGWILPDNRSHHAYPYREAQSNIHFERQVETPAAFYDYHLRNNLYDPDKTGMEGAIPDGQAWEIDQLRRTAQVNSMIPRGRTRHVVSQWWNVPYMGGERPGNIQLEHNFGKYREDDYMVKRGQRDPTLKTSWSEWERGQTFRMPVVLNQNVYGVNPRDYKFGAVDVSGRYAPPGTINPMSSTGRATNARRHPFRGGLEAPFGR